MSKSLRSRLDKVATFADKVFKAEDAILITRTGSTVDFETGVQTFTQVSTAVKVRSWPLTIRERIDLSAAGLEEVEARWAMRVAYASEIEPGDILQVSGFDYEVVPNGVEKDDHAVEWTILTRRTH